MRANADEARDDDHTRGHAVRVPFLRAHGGFVSVRSRRAARAAERAAVSAKIAALEAKTTRRRRSGASPNRSHRTAHRAGERCDPAEDGEETCGGDPAAAIEKLKKSGTTVRVNSSASRR